MKTSGRGGLENLLFIAPAGILCGFWIWTSGGPASIVADLDRLVLRAVNWAADVGAAIVDAVARLL